ncbi:hypothetical protein [Fusobacterium sp. MFO224]|uniref:hypothetical protein n=1 Tax=Fusobacterium sp. MFO224 TaxID=3378070 RepID=UPI003851C5EA
MGYIFEDFEQIKSGEMSGNNKKYYYKYMGKGVFDPKKYRVPIEHYETFSITADRFKDICEKRRYYFSDFEEIESGEMNGNNKKFFYKRKKNC